MIQSRGNLDTKERIASAILGTAFSIFAARAGGPFTRVATGTVALGLLGRALAGHCAMKAALKHQSTFRQGMTDQWQRMRRPFRSGDRRATPAHAGDYDEAPSWMSHQDGRVTGTRVPPGSGDSEAGLTGVNS